MATIPVLGDRPMRRTVKDRIRMAQENLHTSSPYVTESVASPYPLLKFGKVLIARAGQPQQEVFGLIVSTC